MSAPPTQRYRRVVVELGHGAIDARALRAVATLARLLHLDLHGVFIEDESLLAIADLPFSREFRLPAHEWRALDPGRVADELRQAADAAQRLLAASTDALGLPRAFEVLRGDPAACLAGLCDIGDLIAFAEPRELAARASLSFRRLRDAAAASPASVLVLPAAADLRAGPVVAVVVAGPDDPALAAAAAIAALTGDALLILARDPDQAALRARGEALGVPPARLSCRRLAGLAAGDLAAALGATRERMLVVARQPPLAGDIAAASALANARGVPVLLVEPVPNLAPGARG